MNETFLKFEEARVYWWQIFCKCRQIQKRREDKTGKNKNELLTDMQEMKNPGGIAKKITEELLWDYLQQCRCNSKLPGMPMDDGAGIKITSSWLWAYFGCRLLNSKMFSLYWAESGNEQQFTPQEQLEFYHRASTFFLQLLKEIRIETIEKNQSIFRLEELEGITYIQFARSLIYLISEYSHLDVKMPRVFDVEAVLQKTIFSDAYLYMTKERYRDHMFHVIDVCLMGFFLLQCTLTGGQSLESLISQIINKDAVYPDEDVIQNWFLAALFHDIGYSLEAEEKNRENFEKDTGEKDLPIEEWQKKMEIEKLKIHRRNLAELERRKAQYGSNFPLSILNQIGEEKEEIRQLEINLESASNAGLSQLTVKKPQKSNEKKQKQKEDHGVRSCEYVREVLETLAGDNQELLNRFKPALEAIRKHNLMSEKINFSEEPLSFLLVLCDELQEWGRARMDVTELREAVVAKIIFPDTDILPVNTLLEYLWVGVELDETQKCGKIKGESLYFCLFYKDAVSENFEPLAIWLLKSYNFQRLKLPGDGLKIAVTLRNPVCDELRRDDTPGVCEYNLLRDFKRDHRKWRQLQEWFESNDQVKWEKRKEKEALKPGEELLVEYIIMNLNRFSDKKILPENPTGIFDELFQWRREYINGKRRKL